MLGVTMIFFALKVYNMFEETTTDAKEFNHLFGD